MLLKYVKNNDGKFLGCVVAIDKDKVGWSQCHLEKDTFNKKLAKHIAIERAIKGTKKFPHPPEGEKYSPVFIEYNVMCNRARRYFK